MALALTRTAAALFGVLCAALAFKQPEIGWQAFHLAYGGMMMSLALIGLWFAAFGHIARERIRAAIVLAVGIIVGLNAAFEGTLMWMVFVQDGTNPMLLATMFGSVFAVAGFLVAFIWIQVHAALQSVPQTA